MCTTVAPLSRSFHLDTWHVMFNNNNRGFHGDVKHRSHDLVCGVWLAKHSWLVGFVCIPLVKFLVCFAFLTLLHMPTKPRLCPVQL